MKTYTRRNFLRTVGLGVAGLTFTGCGGSLMRRGSADRPNILFIAVDDLNDWIGCLGGHPQVKTPNMDRLAASGVLFSNAHCASPACNPSRTAIMTGLSPHKSGLYENGQKMRDILPDAELLPHYLTRHGYWSGGSGKILHYFIDADSWDEYYPAKETENPFPRTLYPENRPVSLKRGGPWQYVETDWGGLDATDEEFGGDWLVSKWIGEQIHKTREKPFFLACGIYRPHEPWFVPQKYFDMFPLEDIQLPPGYKADDLEDLPPSGQRRGPNRYFAHIREQGQWRQGVQGYLASIAFADAMIGRVIDALESSPAADNTVVVLWGDHGWHLGEKQHWQKYTGWRVCTRIPLMIRVPKGTPGLPQGTQAGGICTRPVNLLDLFPTLTELAGLPAKEDNDGESLVPLLKNPAGKGRSVSVTHLHYPNEYSLSAERWRYIHYRNGDEELYNIATDRFEWHNLAGKPEYADQLERMRALAPKKFAPFVAPKDSALITLEWHAKGADPVPPSKPDGNPFEVVFINGHTTSIRLFRVESSGEFTPHGKIDPEQRKRQKTRPGDVWLVTDQAEAPLGYFVVGDRSARAVVPQQLESGNEQ